MASFRSKTGDFDFSHHAWNRAARHSRERSADADERCNVAARHLWESLQCETILFTRQRAMPQT